MLLILYGKSIELRFCTLYILKGFLPILDARAGIPGSVRIQIYWMVVLLPVRFWVFVLLFGWFSRFWFLPK
jgi:hypothetical protein